MMISGAETVCCVFASSSGWVLCCWTLSQSQQRQWDSYWSTVSGGEPLWNATTTNLKRRTKDYVKSINVSPLSKYKYIYYQVYTRSRASPISAFYNANFTNMIIALSAGGVPSTYYVLAWGKYPDSKVYSISAHYWTYCKQYLAIYSYTFITHVLKPGASDSFTVWHLMESCAAADEWARLVFGVF